MIPSIYPGYRQLLASGELEARVLHAEAHLAACDLCPRRCGVDRAGGATGVCRGGRRAILASYGPHFGEEAPLVGEHGSGTIFLAGCNLKCAFCQNYEISHEVEGEEVSAGELASAMLSLAETGCHNINFVTPTHFAPQILEGVLLAARKGLEIPIVYNCGGYESIDMLRLLDGVVDIYMPDFKFWTEASSRRYLAAPDYPEAARAAIREMHRQVGDLVVRRGIAERGLLVRHLVMPGGLDETEAILRFLAEEISPETFVNVMNQYRPCYRANEFTEIARRLAAAEHKRALEIASQAGLTRVCS